MGAGLAGLGLAGCCAQAVAADWVVHFRLVGFGIAGELGGGCCVE